MSNAVKKQVAQSIIQVRHSDLPLSCPPRGEEVWDKHPRVYLPIEQTGEAVCPYCSARYQLVD